MVRIGLHDCHIDTGKKNLEKTGPDNDMHRHSQDIYHDGNHDKPPANAHDGRQDSHKGAQHQRHQNGESNAGPLEVGLPGQFLDDSGKR